MSNVANPIGAARRAVVFRFHPPKIGVDGRELVRAQTLAGGGPGEAQGPQSHAEKAAGANSSS